MQYLTDNQTRQQGFTLIEVMMAMVILGIGIMSIVALQTRDTMYNNSSRRQSQAYTWAIDKVEELRAMKFTDVKSSLTDEEHGPYKVKWTVKDDSQPNVVKDTKVVTVNVSWGGKDISRIIFTKTDSSI